MILKRLLYVLLVSTFGLLWLIPALTVGIPLFLLSGLIWAIFDRTPDLFDNIFEWWIDLFYYVGEEFEVIIEEKCDCSCKCDGNCACGDNKKE